MDRDYYDDVNVPMPAEPDSPYVDKMREYVDIERSIERAEKDVHQINRTVAEMRARQNKLRASLDGYLNGDRVEAVSA